jgi:hypothetical protein
MIELELHSLKYEVNYKDKSYIIEAIDYFNNTDETKWIVTLDGKQLTKDYVFVHEANKYENIIYNTKDVAANALKHIF